MCDVPPIISATGPMNMCHSTVANAYTKLENTLDKLDIAPISASSNFNRLENMLTENVVPERRKRKEKWKRCDGLKVQVRFYQLNVRPCCTSRRNWTRLRSNWTGIVWRDRTMTFHLKNIRKLLFTISATPWIQNWSYHVVVQRQLSQPPSAWWFLIDDSSRHFWMPTGTSHVREPNQRNRPRHSSSPPVAAERQLLLRQLLALSSVALPSIWICHRRGQPNTVDRPSWKRHKIQFSLWETKIKFVRVN